jgi:hypothetical protein
MLKYSPLYRSLTSKTLRSILGVLIQNNYSETWEKPAGRSAHPSYLSNSYLHAHKRCPAGHGKPLLLLVVFIEKVLDLDERIKVIEQLLR